MVLRVYKMPLINYTFFLVTFILILKNIVVTLKVNIETREFVLNLWNKIHSFNTFHFLPSPNCNDWAIYYIFHEVYQYHWL